MLKKLFCIFLCGLMFLGLCSCSDVHTVGPAVPDYSAYSTAVPTAALPTETAADTPEPTAVPMPTPRPTPRITPVLPTPAPTPVPSTPTPSPIPDPSSVPYYYNAYPTSESEIALAEAGKAFMRRLRTDSKFSKLDINSKHGYPYLICINRVQNCVNVFCADENGQYTRPYLSMVCSAGRNTLTGIFSTKEHYQWHVLMGPCYGQYCTRIVNGILFHSVPYNTMHKYNLRYSSYNRLGTWASHGCIRLAANDAKWIFDNCKSGTIVVIYNNENDPGPIGKPNGIKLDPNDTLLRGWDPTDPDKYNPWGNTYKAGTTLRSELAQADYDYAVATGLWDGTINPSEPTTPLPTEEPTPTLTPEPTPAPTHEIPTVPPTPSPIPKPTPSPIPKPTPSPIPKPTPSPEPTPTPAPTPEPTPTPAPTPEPTPTPAPTQEPTPEPDPTNELSKTDEPTGNRVWNNRPTLNSLIVKKIKIPEVCFTRYGMAYLGKI